MTSSAVLFYISLCSFLILAVATSFVFIRYQWLIWQLDAEDEEGGALAAMPVPISGAMPSLAPKPVVARVTPPRAAAPASASPAGAPVAKARLADPAKIAAAAAKAKAKAAKAAPAKAKAADPFDQKFKTAILSPVSPDIKKPGDTRHDDSEQTGRWFVENRAILERLHNQLGGHHSSTIKKRIPVMKAAKSLASGLSKARDKVKGDAVPAPPPAAVKAEPEQKPARSGGEKRPTLLVKHTSMAEKLLHDKESTEEPAPAQKNEGGQKRPTLLVKHSSMTKRIQAKEKQSKGTASEEKA